MYYSEHAVFIIPDSSQVTWNDSNSWGSVYSTQNINSYLTSLNGLFPDDYFFVAIVANNLLPNKVPNVLTYRHHADGIGQGAITGVGVPNITRYPISGTVIDGAFGVLDHEIGHNWGVFIGLPLGSGHWLANSTVTGQMKDVFSDDNYQTIKQISGDPIVGFHCDVVNNTTRNETETFSDQDLYLLGLAESFPAVHVLGTPVCNQDGSASYSSVATYDQAWVEAHNGVRSPDYQNSQKKFRTAVIYVARDYAEVQAAYPPIERSINHFTNSESIDTSKFRFQVPFLVETKYRASLDGRLADLDGNSTPILTLSSPAYQVSMDGTASVGFNASDADGDTLNVSCTPNSANCSVSDNSVNFTGLLPGTHFFTIKAQDPRGKKAFAHFVIDVE